MISGTRNPIGLFSLLFVSIIVIGFWVISHTVTRSERNIGAFNANREKWESLKPDSFSFVYTAGCMYINEYLVVVNTGDVKAIALNEHSKPNPTSISSIFETAEKAISEAHDFTIDYHPYFGFPESIKVDWDKDVIDDECFVQVTSFEVKSVNET